MSNYDLDYEVVTAFFKYMIIEGKDVPPWVRKNHMPEYHEAFRIYTEISEKGKHIIALWEVYDD